MTFKIAFSGAMNCGKTTKSHFYHYASLQMGLKSELIEEVARSCPFPLDSNSGYATQEWILNRQIELETLAASKKPDVIVCDRSVLDPLVYSKWLRTLDRLSLNELDKVRQTALSWIHTYDAIILCRDYPPVEDGVRLADETTQQLLNKLFDESIDNNKLHTIIRRT